LIEVGADGKLTICGFASGHDGPPLESCPGSAAAGRKGGSWEPWIFKFRSGGLGPVRGRAASCTPEASIPQEELWPRRTRRSTKEVADLV